MSRREKRIVHQIEAEIDDLKTTHAHVAFDDGAECPDALELHRKMLAMESLRDQAMKIFDNSF